MAEQLKVLVTGSSSGIGRASALELAERGHTVFAAARRESELEELARANERIAAVPIDVTDAGAVSAADAEVNLPSLTAKLPMLK